jgi:hypothetical protein
MYTVNGIPTAKVNVGSRSTPFEYAITLAPVLETVSVTTTSVQTDHKGQQEADIVSTEVLCRLP